MFSGRGCNYRRGLSPAQPFVDLNSARMRREIQLYDVAVVSVAVITALTAICYGLYQYDLLVPVASGLLAVAVVAVIIGCLVLVLLVIFFIHCINSFFDECFKKLFDDCFKKLTRIK